MSSGAPPIGPHDGAARERMRDLLSLRAVQAELVPFRLAVSFGKVDRALDVLLAADAARGSALAAFGFPRAALAHHLRRVLTEASQQACS